MTTKLACVNVACREFGEAIDPSQHVYRQCLTCDQTLEAAPHFHVRRGSELSHPFITKEAVLRFERGVRAMGVQNTCVIACIRNCEEPAEVVNIHAPVARKAWR